MSKRHFLPQQNGERKKAKLDVTISDHNFPLSQNAKESNQGDTWGDDNDDEILLLASQACEQAYNDISMLPDYSICMQPKSTSTQMCDPGPSTSKTYPTMFKKPSAVAPNVITSNLKDKCNTISSPLPGMSSKYDPKINNDFDLMDGLIFNDKIFKGQDSEHVYRQLLQMQEENAKLKSENGKLLEKCVTKEGEASILRTQLKSCQVAVDNARMERIKAQEKVQMDWTEKLTAANKQTHDLRTQLDFKNLEIISIKERCRMLESNKVKLTQVTVANNDISASHRNNNISIPNDVTTTQAKKIKTVSNSAQTDNKAHFLKLNTTFRKDRFKLTHILPLILEPTTEQHTLLEYNEKLQNHTEGQNKCRIFSTFHRLPATPVVKDITQAKLSMCCIHEELTCIATDGNNTERFSKILNTIRTVLCDVATQLEMVSKKITTAFLRGMDERYIDATSTFILVDEKDLVSGRCLYKEEQGILARRMTAVLACILHSCINMDIFNNFEEVCSNSGNKEKFIDVINRICNLLDSTSCAVLYSGLLLSLTHLLSSLIQTSCHTKVINVIKCMISSRPMPFVTHKLLQVVRRMSLTDGFIGNLCPGGNGNLKQDYDQGVMLFRKDSCHLQILLKQMEAALKCMEQQQLPAQALEATRALLALHANSPGAATPHETRCECRLVLIQIIVYALRICLKSYRSVSEPNSFNEDVMSVCRGGIQAMYQCWLGDFDVSLLGHYEGHLVEICEVMKGCQHAESYVNMLTELSGTFQSSPEDMTSSFHRQTWVKSFETFTMAD